MFWREALVALLCVGILPTSCFLQKKVFLHLERFSRRHNLLHAAISFEDDLPFGEVRRFDFRPYCSEPTYWMEDTEEHQARWPPELIIDDPGEGPALASKTIHWGVTNRTWKEIMQFENERLCQRYVLGLYDCRHYVSRFAEYATGVPTPIWRLRDLFET
tara:strand:+ start:141 stop:620 length:480 start_codon:yes stop_codon:yes gene_type:complete